VSEYRDARGRYRRRTCTDVLELYGKITLLLLILTGWTWVPPLLHWAIKEWPVQ
jgi:hypothetical protein